MSDSPNNKIRPFDIKDDDEIEEMKIANLIENSANSSQSQEIPDSGKPGRKKFNLFGQLGKQLGGIGKITTNIMGGIGKFGGNIGKITGVTMLAGAFKFLPLFNSIRRKKGTTLTKKEREILVLKMHQKRLDTITAIISIINAVISYYEVEFF